MRRWIVWSVMLVLIAVVLVLGLLPRRAGEEAGTPRPVVVPELSPAAREGREAYDRHCAECHGPHGAGSAEGPPLVHPVYRPAHHADAAFTLAVRRGVPAHHWRFGDMPAQPEVAAEKVAVIARYIRELQVANGIE